MDASREKFYDPRPGVLERLSVPWCASYSGGKDSTSLVTWLEWTRRAGLLKIETPRLVQSDTEVEYPELDVISAQMRKVLFKSGWECTLVHPAPDEKLYNRIFGNGNAPVHPGGTKMRWCTRASKIDPMSRWRKLIGSELTLTGVRLGESALRDSKIRKRMGCAAGGECGLPELSDDTFSPLLHWSLPKVVHWLNGNLEPRDAAMMGDIIPLTKELLQIYDVKFGEPVFECGWTETQITTSRYGCVGCPAIEASKDAPKKAIARHGEGSPLNELYDVWFEARRSRNRLHANRPGKKKAGPLKMAVRKALFERVMDIQRRAGVVLITPADERYIRECWANNVYPRGWSAADELTSDAVAAMRDEPLLQLTINGRP